MKSTHLIGALLALTVPASLACDDPTEGVPAAQVAAPAPAARTPAASMESGERSDGEQTLALTPENTTIAWTGAKVTGSHDGGFRDFTGSLRIPDGDLNRASLTVTIQTASLHADHPRLEGHLKSDDFFDVAKFPTATFESTAVARAGDHHSVTGTLTMHGVSKQVTIPMRLNVAGAELKATSEFTINRQDFGLTYPGMPDDLIKDEVVIRLQFAVPYKTPSQA